MASEGDESERHPVDRILDAVRRLGAEAGVASLSYRSVARLARMGSGTVSYYFPSKSQLVEAVLDRFHRGVDDEIARFLASDRWHAGEFARHMTTHAFGSRDDIRLRLAAWVQAWGLPPNRLNAADRWLTRLVSQPWRSSWNTHERRVLIQSFVWAVQRFASVSDEELVRLVGTEDSKRARAIVVETMGRVAETIAGEDVVSPGESSPG